MTPPPKTSHLKAFGAISYPVLMPGGEGQSFRAGNVVLKPAQNREQTEWISETLSTIEENAFRVLRPIKSSEGSWVYDGWQAYHFLEGESKQSDWVQKIEISRKFHEALSQISKPAFIDKKNDFWAQADREVWSGETVEFLSVHKKIAGVLIALMKPLRMEEQLIHGDMTGNILFHENLAPAVIDFSPYWRPAEYATAIIIVDSIVWEAAPFSLLDELENTFENNQLLMRAALWRIKTSELFSRSENSNPLAEVREYQSFIEQLKKRVSKKRSV